MEWFSAARKSCEKRGYEMVSDFDDGWYVFIKKDGKIHPITEVKLNDWVLEDFHGNQT